MCAVRTRIHLAHSARSRNTSGQMCAGRTAHAQGVARRAGREPHARRRAAHRRCRGPAECGRHHARGRAAGRGGGGGGRAGAGALRADGGGHQHLGPLDRGGRPLHPDLDGVPGCGRGRPPFPADCPRIRRAAPAGAGGHSPALSRAAGLRCVLWSAAVGRRAVPGAGPVRDDAGPGDHARPHLLGDAGGGGPDDPERGGADPGQLGRAVRHPPGRPARAPVVD